VLRSVVIIIVVVVKTFHFSVFRPTLLNAIGTNDVTNINRDSKFSEIEFIIVFFLENSLFVMIVNGKKVSSVLIFLNIVL